MIKTNFVFNHKCRVKKGQLGTVEIRVTIDRKPYYISTGVRCTPDQWKANHVSGTYDDAAVNDRLGILMHRVNEYLNDCIRERKPIDIAEARKQVTDLVESRDESTTPFIDWCADQIAMMRLRQTTRNHYNSLLNRLDEYKGMRKWADVTVEGLYKWDAWLHTIEVAQSKAEALKGEQPRLISDSGVHNYHKCLKALLNRAVKFGRITRNPYEQTRGDFKRGDRENVEYLTDEEIDNFMKITPPVGSEMDVAHDLFIFQMFTGLSYSDAQAFDFSLYRNVKGKWVHTGERIKTGVAYVGHLLPPAVRVLEKYNWQVPKIDNSDYNKCLKALGMVACISRKMHSHLARHTFATYMLRNGARIESVSRMLGHTNIGQTQRYAKVLAQTVHDDFEKIEEKMRW